MLPKDGPLTSFLEDDLIPAPLDQIHDHLWMVGRMLPPRPLHLQLLMAREIILTENVGLHLVWTKGKIFVKPLPQYLLDDEWCGRNIHNNIRLAKCARGLLFTYTALVASESDFYIARNKSLLPLTLDWAGWRELASRFGKGWPATSPTNLSVYTEIDRRYYYGELRLGRLNKICRWTKGSFLYGYSRETSVSLYSDFVSDNFGKLAAVLTYLIIVLTAMQVGLADDLISGDKSFKQACYGFTIFSIIAPLAVSVAILSILAGMFFAHWNRTLREQTRRLEEMGVSIM
jgi:hypothetical protein